MALRPAWHETSKQFTCPKSHSMNSGAKSSQTRPRGASLSPFALWKSKAAALYRCPVRFKCIKAQKTLISVQPKHMKGTAGLATFTRIISYSSKSSHELRAFLSGSHQGSRSFRLYAVAFIELSNMSL